MKYKILENDKYKGVRSDIYNYDFDKVTGYFQRWGKTTADEDDPPFSPVGPEILDWEISTICNMGCKWCYKSNTSVGENLSFENFEKTFAKIPRSVCQIAYGIGSVNAHPDLFRILNHTRDNGIIPNITINGVATDDELEQLAKVCGAISVSHYSDDLCYNAVQKLTELSKRDDTTLYSVNIHQLLAKETYDECLKVISDIKSDPRLADLHAVIYLLLKPKGDRNTLSRPSLEEFSSIVSFAESQDVSIGMDSCSAPMMIKYIGDNNQSELLQSIEPCESFGLFSSYMNTKCEYFPCSFAEGEGEWKEGINVLECEDFLKDVWFSKKISKWRAVSLGATSACECKMSQHCRVCPIFDITPCFAK